MDRDQKAAVIEEVAAEIRDAGAVFAVDFRGISVKQSADLRARLDEAGGRFRVVKNRLTERAADQAGAESLKAFLEGPTAFAFVRGDVALVAKALAAFRREAQRLEFKGGIMDGQALTAADLEALALLPPRDVLYGQLVGVAASPLSGLARGLAGLLQALALQLGQIRDQGLVGGDSPTPDETSDRAGAEAALEPSEAPGAPVAEAVAAEEESSENETPSEGEPQEREG